MVEADPQLVNPVAEEVRFGPAKVVPQLPQAFDPNEALESCLGGQTAEPIEDRDGSVVVAVENDFGPGHRPKLPTSSQVEYPQICETSQGVRFRNFGEREKGTGSSGDTIPDSEQLSMVSPELSQGAGMRLSD